MIYVLSNAIIPKFILPKYALFHKCLELSLWQKNNAIATFVQPHCTNVISL